MNYNVAHIENRAKAALSGPQIVVSTPVCAKWHVTYRKGKGFGSIQYIQYGKTLTF